MAMYYFLYYFSISLVGGGECRLGKESEGKANKHVLKILYLPVERMDECVITCGRLQGQNWKGY